MKKRLLSFILSVVMIAGMIPLCTAPVSAEGETLSEVLVFDDSNIVAENGSYRYVGENFTITADSAYSSIYVGIDCGIYGGGKIEATNPNVTITGIDTVVKLWGCYYGEVSVSRGTKVQTGEVADGSTVNVTDIDSNVFSFTGGNSWCVFGDITVYYTVADHNHVFDSTDNGDGTHTAKCRYCDTYGETEAHTFTLTDNGDGTHAETCVCGLAGESLLHVFTDGVCPCGVESEKETLVFKGPAFDQTYSSTGTNFKITADHADKDGIIGGVYYYKIKIEPLRPNLTITRIDAVVTYQGFWYGDVGVSRGTKVQTGGVDVGTTVNVTNIDSNVFYFTDGSLWCGFGDITVYYTAADHDHDFSDAGASVDNGNGTHTAKCRYCDTYGEKSKHSFTAYADNGDGTHTGSCVCGATDKAAAHAFTTAVDNGDGTHTGKCVCGKTELARHAFTYADNSDGTHKGTCICGKTETAGHVFTYTVNTDGTHTRTCICGKTETSAHTFVPADNGDGTHTGKCICGATGETAAHAFAPIDNGDGTHTEKCVCGVTGETAAHSCNDDGVCSLCGGFVPAEAEPEILPFSADNIVPNSGSAYLYETENFRVSGNSTDANDGVRGGGSFYWLKIEAKNPLITINKIEAVVGKWGADYGDVVVNGTKTQTGAVDNGSTVEITDINSDTVLFAGGNNKYCLFKDIKVYYTTVPEHEHDFSGACRDNGDGTHSAKCIHCQAYGTAVNHRFADGTALGVGSEEGHVLVCPDCGTQSAIVPHTFTETLRDNEDYTHSRLCSACGEYGAPEAHVFENGFCVCGAEEWECEVLPFTPGEETDYTYEGGVFKVTGMTDWQKDALVVGYDHDARRSVSLKIESNIENANVTIKSIAVTLSSGGYDYEYVTVSSGRKIESGNVADGSAVHVASVNDSSITLGTSDSFAGCTVTDITVYYTHEHLYNVYTDNDDGTHSGVCAVCEAPSEPEAHVYDVCTDNGNGTHTKSCVCGAVGTVEEHNFTGECVDNWGGTHLVKCVDCGVFSEPMPHVFDGGDCACGAPEGEAFEELPFSTDNFGEDGYLYTGELFKVTAADYDMRAGLINGNYMPVTVEALSPLVTITRVEATVGAFASDYDKVAISSGTKLEQSGVPNGSSVHVIDIGRSTFSFGGSGSSDYVQIRDIRVYYTHTHSFEGDYVDNGDGSTHCRRCEVCDLCDESAENHVYGDEYRDNEDGLTHFAVCTLCGGYSEAQTHTYENYVCTACGYADLATARQDAVNAIENARTEANGTVADAALLDIADASTPAEVSTILTQALADMTAADELAEAKKNAVDTIEAARTEANGTVADAALLDIADASTPDEVSTILTQALADMTAADELAEAKKNAVDTIEAARTEANGTVADAALLDIANASTPAEVSNILTQALLDMVAADELAEAKKNAVEAIEAARTPENGTVADDALLLIAEASTPDEVSNILSQALTDMDAADAAALASAKTAAKAALDAAKTGMNDNIAEIAKTRIDAATSIASVEAIKEQALLDMAELDAAKNAANAEIDAAKTPANASVAEEAKTEIAGAPSITDVNSIKAQALLNMAAADAALAEAIEEAVSAIEAAKTTVNASFAEEGIALIRGLQTLADVAEGRALVLDHLAKIDQEFAVGTAEMIETITQKLSEAVCDEAKALLGDALTTVEGIGTFTEFENYYFSVLPGVLEEAQSLDNRYATLCEQLAFCLPYLRKAVAEEVTERFESATSLAALNALDEDYYDEFEFAFFKGTTLAFIREAFGTSTDSTYVIMKPYLEKRLAEMEKAESVKEMYRPILELLAVDFFGEGVREDVADLRSEYTVPADFEELLQAILDDYEAFAYDTVDNMLLNVDDDIAPSGLSDLGDILNTEENAPLVNEFVARDTVVTGGLLDLLTKQLEKLENGALSEQTRALTLEAGYAMLGCTSEEAVTVAEEYVGKFEQTKKFDTAVKTINDARTSANGAIADAGLAVVNALAVDTTEEALDTILQQILADMQGADNALEAAKTDAVNSLNALKNNNNAAIVERAISDIRDAGTTDEVTAIYEKALADMEAVDALLTAIKQYSVSVLAEEAEKHGDVENIDAIVDEATAAISGASAVDAVSDIRNTALRTMGASEDTVIDSETEVAGMVLDYMENEVFCDEAKAAVTDGKTALGEAADVDAVREARDKAIYDAEKLDDSFEELYETLILDVTEVLPGERAAEIIAQFDAVTSIAALRAAYMLYCEEIEFPVLKELFHLELKRLSNNLTSFTADEINVYYKLLDDFENAETRSDILRIVGESYAVFNSDSYVTLANIKEFMEECIENPEITMPAFLVEDLQQLLDDYDEAKQDFIEAYGDILDGRSFLLDLDELKDTSVIIEVVFEAECDLIVEKVTIMMQMAGSADVSTLSDAAKALFEECFDAILDAETKEDTEDAASEYTPKIRLQVEKDGMIEGLRITVAEYTQIRNSVLTNAVNTAIGYIEAAKTTEELYEAGERAEQLLYETIMSETKTGYYFVDGKKPVAGGENGIVNRGTYYVDDNGEKVVLEPGLPAAEQEVTFAEWYLRTAVQFKETEDGGVNVRFVSMLDDSLDDYCEAGFTYTVGGADSFDPLTTQFGNTSYVVDGKTVKVGDFGLGEEYFILRDVDFAKEAVDADLEISVTPYVLLADKETYVTGETVSFKLGDLAEAEEEAAA